MRTTTAISAYETPDCWEIEIDIQGLVCTSTMGLYEDENEYEF